MRFGTCHNCNTYKYLATGTRCQSCKPDKTNWLVVQAACVRRGSRVILHDNLTKQQATTIADDSEYKVATTRFSAEG